MLTDPREQHLAAAFKAARPLPRAGWDARALAALTDIRPRRHPNLLTFIIVAALLLLLAAGVFAAVRHFFFVEGTLEFSSSHEGLRFEGDDGAFPVGVHFLSGEDEWGGGVPPHWMAERSPVSDQIVFRRNDDPWIPTSTRIFISSADRSAGIWTPIPEEVDLTEVAGLSGVHCNPKFSPDGTMIAFHRAEPIEGQLPCEAGFHAWVMNTDGSEARPLLPEGSRRTWCPWWSEDGSFLVVLDAEDTGDLNADASWICVDLSGRQLQVLDPGARGPCCPEGSPLAFVDHERGELNGEAGWWQRLIVEDAEGVSRRVRVEQFIADADMEAHYAEQGLDLPSGYPWQSDLLRKIGPSDWAWSPSRDRVAFLAAIPFDPHGPFYTNQVEVWVYDFNTDELLRLTHDDFTQHDLVWADE